ncbi:hypothetical protein [Sphingosinicella sp. CPCC 101087]|uniref:hypothetical protein n=1 Tax=Sphingosinicella sp. CPCC 101087 TaxID=2497754 RepID=UPI00101D263F|nr:hypothetical protein [Sphingosinicella sp. CPCC 101087]
MAEAAKRLLGEAYLAEISEFASFSKAAQRYIRRSIDVGLARRDAVRRWARDPGEAGDICQQARHYRRLDDLRGCIPDDAGIEEMEPLMAPLVTLSAFDLGAGRLDGFGAYRFLYERLVGAAVRPWLPGAFCAAAALPHIHPDRRRGLLQSISESAATAPGWSNREPVFFPEWVEKVDLAVA